MSSAIVCVSFSILVLLYGFLLSRLIPRKFHAISNLSASIVGLLIALNFGLSAVEIGISFDYILRGVVVAIIFSALVLMSILVLATIPALHKYFLSQTSILKSDLSEVIYETIFRIPMVTALFEEFIFRGLLLALFLQYYSRLHAVLFSSIVFGLWHVFPAINNMNQNHYKKNNSNTLQSNSFIAGNVLITGTVGALFSWLRLISGSILAPWLLHWTINAGGIFGVLFARKQSKKYLH